MRLAFAVMLPLLALVIPVIAVPANTITVCSLGCDYSAIQPAIDAAHPGDTILIAAGTYTGQLTLKSNLALTAPDGPTQTIVTASASPIVSGNNIVSVTLQGLGLAGQGMSTPLGIDLLDSTVVLSNIVVSNLHGTQGITDQPHGGGATAIHLTGTFQVLLINSILQDIAGGDGVDSANSTGAAGGDATGVQAHGNGNVNVSHTVIRRLQGGHAGDAPYSLPSICDFGGGLASALNVTGPISLTVNYLHASDLMGGSPCREGYTQCSALAGSVNGVRAEGGTTILTDNRFENLAIWPARSSEPAMAIRTANTTTTLVARNVITNLAVLDSLVLQSAHRPESPYCWPAPGSVIGIASTNDQVVQITSNTLNTLLARGVGGYAQAIAVQEARNVTLTHNTLTSVTGGSASQTTGIQIGQSSEALVEANRLEHIQGSGTRSFGYNLYAIDGGDAVGIALQGVNAATLENNTAWSITGGDGNPTLPAPSVGGNGGNATGLMVSQGMMSIWNNVFAQTRPGAAGTALSITGTAVGLYVAEAEVLAINNILIDHGSGISVTLSGDVLAAYNDLWSNGVDYRGVSPSLGDIHANPWFSDTGQGDFHLTFNSPLIDAGFTLGAPAFDFDGEPRPRDGNDDGLARADIGATEYQFVPLDRAFLPIVFAAPR